MPDNLHTENVSDSIKDLERELARRRDRLVMTLESLRNQLQDASDWRHWFQKHPIGFLASATVLGWLLGFAVPVSRRR